MALPKTKFIIVDSLSGDHIWTLGVENRKNWDLVCFVLWDFYWIRTSVFETANCFGIPNSSDYYLRLTRGQLDQKTHKRMEVIERFDVFSLVIDRHMGFAERPALETVNTFQIE